MLNDLSFSLALSHMVSHLTLILSSCDEKIREYACGMEKVVSCNHDMNPFVCEARVG